MKAFVVCIVGMFNQTDQIREKENFETWRISSGYTEAI